jgi:hypothetical protein
VDARKDEAMNILIRHGRKPNLISVATLRKRLAKMPDEFTFRQFCDVNKLTLAAGQKTIIAAKKYKFIVNMSIDSKFVQAIYRKVLQ